MQITLSGVSRPHLSLLKGHDEVHNGNLENNIAPRRFFKLSDYIRGYIALFGSFNGRGVIKKIV